MACPTHMFTSALNVWGLGTWDGGTKISLRFSTGYVTTYSYPDFTFQYSTYLPGAITNYAGTVINMAVTDDGHAFMYVRLSGSGYMGLYDLDIAAGTATLHDADVTNNNRLQGPAWNPYDGMLYELWADSGTYRLLRWDPSTPSAPTEVTTFAGSDFSASDMLAFTEDGGAWYDWQDQSTFTVHPNRLDLSTLAITVFSGVDGNGTVPVPNSDSSVLVSAVDQGWELHTDGSVVDTDCTLFDSPGTARVHCGVDGLVTFLYPTSGGVGTEVYALTATSPPVTTGRWRTGRVGWAA